MKIVIFECRRAFREKSFRISLLLSSMLVLTDLHLFWSEFGTSPNKVVIQAWIGTDYMYACNSLFYVLLPVFACLPYAGSYFADCKSGYDKNICVRVSRMEYFWGKVSSVFLTGFCAVAFPLILNLFLVAGLFPNHSVEKLEFLAAAIKDSHLFSLLFYQKPHLYALIFILIDGLIGGLMGLISLSVTKACSTLFSAVMIPFLIYIVTGVLFQSSTESGHLSLMEMANPMQSYVTTAQKLIGTYLVVLLVTMCTTYIQAKGRDIL
ncbi:MAG: hypothetical protein IKL22_12070 [Lachnospiraceae bacterium]|nr:hypothetical protein [Lachnospiraceae bacterium]